MRPYVLLTVIALVQPCRADEPATQLEYLLPLALGNCWKYKVSTQDDQRFGPRVQDDRFVVRVARQEMVGEQTCFRLDASLKDRVVASEHLAFTKDGLFRYRVDKEDVVPPVCVLRLPAAKGPRWRHPYQVGSRAATGAFSVSSADVNVPFGKYKAVVVHANIDEGGRPSTRTIVSYAEGVGIVKQEVVDGKRTLTLELEKFEKEDEK